MGFDHEAALMRSTMRTSAPEARKRSMWAGLTESVARMTTGMEA